MSRPESPAWNMPEISIALRGTIEYTRWQEGNKVFGFAFNDRHTRVEFTPSQYEIRYYLANQAKEQVVMTQVTAVSPYRNWVRIEAEPADKLAGLAVMFLNASGTLTSEVPQDTQLTADEIVRPAVIAYHRPPSHRQRQSIFARR